MISFGFQNDPPPVKPTVSKSSTLSEFFEDWYVSQTTNTKHRKPTGQKTIEMRRSSVKRWMKEMGNIPIGKITEQHLEEYANKLRTATYQRSSTGRKRLLSEVTIDRHLSEVDILLSAAGPKNGRYVRAGVINEVPYIYREPIPSFPKPTWELGEAQAVAKSAISYGSDRHQAWRKFTLLLWFHTGHRARTYTFLKFSHIKKIRKGCSHFQFRSIKTGKPVQFVIHPELLESIEACKSFSEDLIAPWDIKYRTIQKHHERWQVDAGLEEDRRFSPQAWRRLHAQQIEAVGYSAVLKSSSEALGHSSTSITEGHYSNARDTAILSLPRLFTTNE